MKEKTKLQLCREIKSRLSEEGNNVSHSAMVVRSLLGVFKKGTMSADHALKCDTNNFTGFKDLIPPELLGKDRSLRQILQEMPSVVMLINKRHFAFKVWDANECAIIPSTQGGFLILCHKSQTIVAHSDSYEAATEWLKDNKL